MGVVCGCVYLIFMFLFIPVPLSNLIYGDENFLYKEVRLFAGGTIL